MRNINIIKHKRIRIYTEQTDTIRVVPEYYEVDYISNGKWLNEFFDTLAEAKLFIKQNKF
tara:strand:+ start:52 stop:231 length:180 start_codon:yes stop_codon:yes gene_type:complete